jgi:queuine tRNA-ribosyltransferase
VGYPAPRSKVERAVDLSGRWAERCLSAHTRLDQALFGIVQGGMDLGLRLRSLRQLEGMGDFPGYGIGGYSVGEDHETMFESLEPLTAEYMPRGKPRYLMGVGSPSSLVRGVACGIDMFDCVLPTRTGRTGTAFSSEGRLNLKNARFIHDAGPLDSECGCPVCRGGYSRAYIHHLVRQSEMLGSILVSTHNIYYLLDLMRRAREAIIAGTYGSFVSAWNDSPASKDW